MIAGIFHQGSGIGNQLHRYVMTRVLALDKGLEWGMVFPENFKGQSFMNLDMGNPVSFIGQPNNYTEKRINRPDGTDVRDYDWEGVLGVRDNTIIDGEFQGEKYFEHHLDKIREWFKVDEIRLPNDLCIINFRGGEYTYFPELFLTKEYWEDAIKLMQQGHPSMKFKVVTDDVAMAQVFFPDFEITHSKDDWATIRYAKNLILSNSSFAILPALLGDAETVIAPKYWARRNIGFWALPYNNYKRFIHI